MRYVRFFQPREGRTAVTVTGSRINRQRVHGGFIRVRYQRRADIFSEVMKDRTSPRL
jgi:hypothetical protein